MADPEVTADQVGKAGIRLFINLYGSKKEDSLRNLRYTKFMEMVSTRKTSTEPQKLPPTERSAYYHSLRVHLQVVAWKMLKNNALDETQWGWKLKGNTFEPIMTDSAIASENLLQFVRCKCKLTSKNPCGRNICSCRKNWLKCVAACGDCRGVNCNNAEDVVLVLDDKVGNIENNGEVLWRFWKAKKQPTGATFFLGYQWQGWWINLLRTAR